MMLKTTLAPSGIGSRVELDGQDISHFVSEITVGAAAGGSTSITLRYMGAAVVEGEAGEIKLVQAEHLVICSECQRIVAGEKAAPRFIMADRDREDV